MKRIRVNVVLEMVVGLPKSPCRRRYQNTLQSCILRDMVPSGIGKRHTKVCQLRIKELNGSEPSTRYRKNQDYVKTIQTRG